MLTFLISWWMCASLFFFLELFCVAIRQIMLYSAREPKLNSLRMTSMSILFGFWTCSYAFLNQDVPLTLQALLPLYYFSLNDLDSLEASWHNREMAAGVIGMFVGYLACFSGVVQVSLEALITLGRS